ncbi:MAG TPA: L-2-hydroxyglutarate oxidase [Gemmatimonadaceae bacterium]|nr:L-2-hydroxyglutarate oxidase [Gemmatimonadaceae bacterium]
MTAPRVLIVGGGIIGLATAYQLTQTYPDAEPVVLEKEDAVGRHQTGRNSGVLHAGLYYKPGSVKARLAVSGIRAMTAFCQRYGIPHEICGKLVVATTDEEVPRLRTLLERGTENGLHGLRWLSADEAREIEPAVRAVAAVHVPEEGIVDYRRVAETLAACVAEAGGRVVCNARVTALRQSARGWVAETTAGAFEGDRLINCAGLQSDRIAAMAGARQDVRIVGFRGEYYRLRPDRQHLVRNLIYPTPDPAFPFLGVHFTRQIKGGIEAGPNAVLALAREGYGRSRFEPLDAASALVFPGLWRFIARYPGVCVAELRRSWSRRLFAAALARLVPDITPADLIAGGVGIRAQAMRSDGSLVEDFHFVTQPGAVHVINAPSPGATASLAIGCHIVDQLRHESLRRTDRDS